MVPGLLPPGLDPGVARNDGHGSTQMQFALVAPAGALLILRNAEGVSRRMLKSAFPVGRYPIVLRDASFAGPQDEALEARAGLPPISFASRRSASS
jgi:hypothetical protein